MHGDLDDDRNVQQFRNMGFVSSDVDRTFGDRIVLCGDEQSEQEGDKAESRGQGPWNTDQELRARSSENHKGF